MIAIVALLAGIALGLWLEPTLPGFLTPYLPIMIVASLDALFGAARAWLDGIYSDRVFATSFFSNVLIAALIVFVGDSRINTPMMKPRSLPIYSIPCSHKRQKAGIEASSSVR